MKLSKKVKLEKAIARKKISLQKAQDNSLRVYSNLGWGSGMRKVKLVSFNKEDNIQYELDLLEKELKQLMEVQ